MHQKYGYTLIGIISSNALIYFLLFPYAQQTVNSHVSEAPLLGVLFYGIAGVCVLISLYFFTKEKDYKLLFLILVFAVTMSACAYKFQSLLCTRCLNSA